MKLAMLVIAGAAAAWASAAGAALTQVGTTVSASGPFNGSLTLLNDGVYPPNGQNYQVQTVHDYGSTTFTFTFPSAVAITAFNTTVDNNDNYVFTFNNGPSTLTRTINAADGSVGGGVETFTSDPSLPGTYLASLSFAPFTATSVTVSTNGGDGLYSIGEAEFFTNAVNGVPEPASWAMLLIGFGMIGIARRSRHSAVPVRLT